MAGTRRPKAAAETQGAPKEGKLSPEEIARRYAVTGYDLPNHPAHVIRRAHQRATMRFQELMGHHGLTPRSWPPWRPCSAMARYRRTSWAG